MSSILSSGAAASAGSRLVAAAVCVVLVSAGGGVAQQPPYDVRPAIAPPYWRVRFEAGTAPELVYPATFTVWMPPGVATLRGVVVHQHGCGTGSCSGGFTAAHDLHWQALAARHGCALVAPVYEQPDKADCQAWCDPRNGSARAFTKALGELGAASGHPELATVPWALWGHSGGGHWVGGMTLLFPERVVGAWLRSGVPLLEADADRPGIKPHDLPAAALAVPMLLNLGVKEGVSGGDERFAGVWPANQTFFNALRSRGGLVGVAIDPLSSHDCGNQRYLAIPWLDACLAVRLPATPGAALVPIDPHRAWLAPITGGEAVSAAELTGDGLALGWLPNESTARRWMEYVRDTLVADDTPPPAPTLVRVVDGALEWSATADPESGLAGFVIERDGTRIATLPEQPRNPFGRPVFQNLLYSDTPPQPLQSPRFVDPAPVAGAAHAYRVIAVNTVGLESAPSAPAGR
ncbi:MAG: hypothetical protein ACKO9B_10865 [Planctomycetota bacterium]